jgi:UDP-N-acetylmuramyl pentapeptide phosphotransferase/UDP-N-acetylglucosamine-1-phosphate transferase
MPELQGMGHHQAVAELRRGLILAHHPHVYGWLAICFAIALCGAMAARRYAFWRDLMDHPGERRSHAVATPRGGGVGIVVAMLLAMTLLASWSPSHRVLVAASATGLLLVAGIGWLDDHRPLPAWSRLAVHAVAGGLLAFAIHRWNGQAWLAIAGFVLAVSLVNIWNFMDGIDGLATSQAVLVAAACVMLLPGHSAARWLALALVASGCGFLPMNLVHARIFLGDVGSGALGYLLAVISVMTIAESNTASTTASTIFLLLLPVSAFLVDAALTLASRMLRGESWWMAHVEHGYQRWAKRMGSHLPVTLAYAAWTLVASLLMLVMRGMPLPFIMATCIAWYLWGGITWTWLRSPDRKGLPRT